MGQAARKVITLEQGEYAPLPGDPKWVLCGPAKLELIRYDDGRIDGNIVEGKSSEARMAVFRKLRRVGWEI